MWSVAGSIVHRVVACAVLFGSSAASDPCGASDHKNSNGNNLRQGADVDKHYDCCSQCDYNDGCRGWTFVYNGNNQGQCWLKSWVPPGTEWTYDPDVISGGVPPPRKLTLSAPTPAPALRSDPCGASDHKNSNGNNLRQGADVDKYYDCCSQCDYNEGCRGWTFVYNGNNQGQCWLKSWVPPGTEWTYDADVISGGVPPPRKLTLSAPTPAPALRSDPCGASDHKNSNGNNLRQGADVDKYYDCCSQCDYNEGCRGWTFVYNGNNPGQCWLKSWVPPGTEWTYDADVISGGVPPPREL